MQIQNLENTKNPLRGLLALLAAVALYGMYGVYSRMIGIGFGIFSQAWARSLIIIVILGGYFLSHKKKWREIEKKDFKWMIIWPLSGTSVMIFLFIAFNHLPIGTGYFLFYSTMILSGILSGKMLFKEKLSFVKVLSVVLAIAGLVIIYSFDIPLGKMLYVALALLSGFFLGLWNTLSKKVSDKYPNMQLVLIDSMLPFAISILGAIAVKESMPSLSLTNSWLWIVVFAVTQICSTGFLVYGFKNLEAQIGSVIMPVEVIFATLFGFLFFKEILPATSLLGGGLIVLAAVLPSVTLLVKKDIMS